MADDRERDLDQTTEAGTGHEGTGLSTGGPAGGSGGMAYDESQPEHTEGRPSEATEAPPTGGSSEPTVAEPKNVRDEVASSQDQQRPG